MRKLILFIFIIFLFQVIEINSFEPPISCSIQTNCNENTIFYMYNNVDTHVSKTNTNWPQKLCCSSDMGNSCNPDILNTPLFKLYLSSDGHVSLTNSNYPEKVCLSVNNVKTGQGNIACTLKYNNQACDQGQKCIITLSSSDDAHVSACDVAGSYPNKLCCGATVCPPGFTYDPLQKTCIVPAACYVGDVESLTSDPNPTSLVFS